MSLNRRKFLANGSIYLAGLGLSSVFPLEALASLRKTVSPNDRINVGLIGCNGMGFSDLTSILKNSEVSVVALCDVDERVLATKTADLEKAGIKKPVWYTDYRKLLENKDIDAVIIGTPDHWHCLILIDALEAGKDVYCEKPIANSVEEANIMLNAVKRHKQVVQVGQWQRSMKHFNDAVAFVHSGKLGNIRLVKAWSYIGWKKSIPVAPDEPVPAGVDYNMWLGPAQKRPFNINRFHFNFRWFWDYAGGLMTDWGVHLLDYAIYGMNVKDPKSIVALGGKYAYPNDAQETPDTLQTIYDFGGFSILWEHAMGIGGGNYGRDHGIAYIGDNGTLILNRGGWEVIPEAKKMEAVSLIKPSDNGLDLNTTNFIDVMKSRDLSKLNCPIEIGYNAALISHLGNIAYKTGERIYWDAGKQKFNNSKANDYLKAQYHNSWKLPKS
ncbi:Gfo/Idh/MocA family oxidoreductase [Pedobacter sp. HMF7647]|uniref:Gfo/Idh/MocA family oxidoreductase n=1 Tax=Hufsiella arboris TaxID=2695275 RepID=A0A7K1Y5Y8_9SPHI|nr:Gfo/Idh/MocA family oxidoreductase [Hufsiella arboris]MXV49438.1 Gfo/Idh/MocA family oxidoreductase [Hufsiella arboris]